MSGFKNALKGTKDFNKICDDIRLGALPIGVLGVANIHKALLIHSTLDDKRRAIVITPDEATASKLCDDLKAFGTKALLYPTKDISLVSAQTRSKEYEQQRMGALSAYILGDCDVIAMPVSAALQKTVAGQTLKQRMINLKVGNEVDLEDLISALLAAGYKRADEVEGHGQFAVRGGIVDFFPPDRELPLRLELFGDEIDTIAEFETLSQRRTDNVDGVLITPSSEIFSDSNELLADRIDEIAKKLKKDVVKEKLYNDAQNIKENISSVCLDKYINLIYEDALTPLSYMGDKDLLFVIESAAVKERANAYVKLFHEDIKEALESGDYAKQLGDLIITFNNLLEDYQNANTIYLDNFARGSFDTPVHALYNLSLGQMPMWNGTISALTDDILTEKATTVIAAGTEKGAKAIAEELNERGYKAIYSIYPPKEFPKSKITVLPTTFSTGLTIPEVNFELVTHGQVSGGIKKKYRNKAENAFHSLDELHKGDYIVHNIHGVGVFEGIENLAVGGIQKDYIKIKYAKGDVLYVPVTQLDLVSKYIGPKDEAKTVKLNRLGGKEWEKSKQKVRTAVKDMADELTKLYAERMATPGYAFSPDIDMQSDFERRFEFDETEDQLRCINEIKKDMERPVPMDRLLCGDVGFGKTEVALRAAFKCIAEGKQCAFLVPTTILAFQHYNTILKRFDGFPFEIEMLSRFRTPAQQRKTVKNIKNGYTDIVVGTHRLISKDVEFKDLGLLIIDEEQRFGVAQKEKLKEKFPNVDVLTLSATPIPRTLNMAMTGIRDMSIIEEAPLDRHPVQSYVMEYDPSVVAQAIEKELRRGGQVYYMHNNVESITGCAARIHEMVPEARIGIAHGKMGEDELSDVWRRLVEGEIDVLVCTTIIETGVDVPNANTLIIENSDHLGLSQLHQIRGRIGRSARRASAYFTFYGGKELTEIAYRRLNAIREYTEFGSGFKIALRDLELRGAGSLLGAQQHGHMEAVGYDMYLKILSEAISENKDLKENKKIEEKKECLIDIQINAHIPDGYIESVPARLSIYRRIADVRTNEDAMDVTDELIDRFGEPPQSVLGLIEVSLLRNTAANLGVYEIGQRGENLILYWNNIDMNAVARLNETMRGKILVSGGSKPYVSVKVASPSETIKTLKHALMILTAAKKEV
ncbi:MAG: transcription-repair coupling factor [Clostridia bacterium]|nr:transcription-repair coupling factor [Clostridia bacterium]